MLSRYCATASRPLRLTARRATFTQVHAGRNQGVLAEQAEPVLLQKIAPWTQRGQDLGWYKNQMTRAADEGLIKNAFSVLEGMQATQTKPDRELYHSFLRLLSKERMQKEVMAVISDMRAFGIKPNHTTWTYAWEASVFGWKDFEVLQREMARDGLKMNEVMHGQIIMFHILNNNLESALHQLEVMQDEGLVPRDRVMFRIISLAATSDHSRLAYDLALNFERVTERQIGIDNWVDILESSLRSQFNEGVEEAMKRLEISDVPLDEGVCLEILNWAAVRNRPEQATKAVANLKALAIPLQEHHLAPLVHLFCNSGSIPSAFDALDAMLRSKSDVTRSTLESFKSLLKTENAVEEACQLLDRRKQPNQLNIAHVNAILIGMLTINDWKRALDLYNKLSEYDIKPNLETYHVLFDLCRSNGPEEPNRLLADLESHGFKPDAHILERMFFVSIKERNNYEAAFYYLEELKALVGTPQPTVYDLLVRWLIMRKDPRAQMAYDEAVESGVNFTPQTRGCIDSWGGVKKSEPAAKVTKR